MSEFQYYEFRKIGGALSDDAMKEIAALSSRAQVSRTSAVFVYHFGDFRGNPIKVLAKHFDILFYMANWGTRQLAFRFPVAAVDSDVFAPFVAQEVIEVKRQGAQLLVDICYEDANPGGWLEGEGVLDRLSGLYEDLLAGDLRALFLLWLQSVTLQDEPEDDEPLPFIPAGLGQLAERHRALLEVFNVNPDLVAAAEPFSAPIVQIGETDLVRALEAVPAAEQTRFLERLVLSESPLAIITELRMKLQSFARTSQSPPAQSTPPPPSIRLLLSRADQIQAKREAETRERDAAKERERFEKIEHDEAGLWRQVDELIAKKSIKAYDEAVRVLQSLRDLALYRQRREEFDRKIEAIRAGHPRLPGLLGRLRDGKLR